MQNKKGLYLLFAFVGTILVFFCVLFFVHERTLENGILFTLSFNYENAQDITYNFYNQNGKIEKVEVGENYENSFILEKTEYKSVKLLRKIIKGLKEKKEKPTEEGITIYNGQNKRYYLLAFDSEPAKELSNLIIDNYIHSEMTRMANQPKKNEIYLFEEKETLKWTNDATKKRIIHTYQCSEDSCKGIYSDSENNEKILYDGNELYLYNYITKNKTPINVEEEIIDAKLIKKENQLTGLEITNKEKKNAYYDMSQNKLKTPFKNCNYSIINSDLILETLKEDNHTNLQVWDYQENKQLWNENFSNEKELIYNMNELNRNQIIYYVLEKRGETKSTYQVYNQNWIAMFENKIVNSVELKEDGILKVEIEKENQTYYEEYDTNGVLIEQNKTE